MVSNLFRPYQILLPETQIIFIFLRLINFWLNTLYRRQKKKGFIERLSKAGKTIVVFRVLVPHNAGKLLRLEHDA
tara:strand:- start:1578 stop:1802 length:225 start_codon:yes stop_codon:yes gene_type:complete